MARIELTEARRLPEGWQSFPVITSQDYDIALRACPMGDLSQIKVIARTIGVAAPRRDTRAYGVVLSKEHG